MKTILHIIPKITFGGGLSNIIGEIHFTPLEERPEQVICIVLEPSYNAQLAKLALRHRIRLVIAPTDEECVQLLSKAELVVVQYWNSPVYFTFFTKLAQWEIPNRYLLHVRVLGSTPPQILPPKFLALFTGILLTNPKLKEQHPQLAVPMLNVWGIGLHLPPLDWVQIENDFSELKLIHAGTINPFKLHPRFLEMHDELEIPFSLNVYGVESDALVYYGNKPIFLNGFKAEVWNEFDQFHFLAYPQNSLSYGSSDLVVQEAMWRGLPPVLIQGTGLDAFLEHGSNCLLAKDETDYQNLLAFALAHAAEMKVLGQRCHQYAKTHFHPNLQAAKVFGAYRKWLELPAKPFRFPYIEVAEFFKDSIGDSFERMNQQTADTNEIAFVLQCEGGLVHYLKYFGDNPQLRAYLNKWTVES